MQVLFSVMLQIKNQGEALNIINSEGIAYHQHNVLYLIKPQEMQPSADDIRLRR